MSSIWKHPKSPFWSACFTALVGGNRRVQLKLSTATEDKKLARRIADELEDAGRGMRSVEQITAFLETINDLRTQRTVRHAFDHILRLTTGTGLGAKSARGFIGEWLARSKGEVKPGTWTRYDSVARAFIEHLGGKADADLSALKREDIARFRDESAKRVARGTANLSLKIVRLIFAAAEADGVVSRNEARLVKPLKTGDDEGERRPFTLEELKRILETCDPEWRSMVLFSLYGGGLRLSDVAALTWANVDLQRNELRCASRKTGRRVIVPLSAPLRAHVESLPSSDDPDAPLHPRAYATVQRTGLTGALSNGFRDILAAAGLVAKRTHQANPKKHGRSSRRELSDVGFHALRHTAVSLLKLAGVADVVAMDLAGHESAEISRFYTHVDHATKMAALNRLPDLVTPGSVAEGKPKR